MSRPIDLGEDAGRADVTIGGTTVSVDVWHAYQGVMERARRAEPGEFNRQVIALLAEMGFGAVSGFTAERFAEKVLERVAELKKNAGPASASPGSPASTAPESSG